MMEIKDLNNRIQKALGNKCSQSFDAQNLFLYDDENNHKSVLATSNNDRLALNISNPASWSIQHYCIDGGIIPFGQSTYSFRNLTFSHRCDSLLLTDQYMIFVELKLNIDSTCGDACRWDQFSHAMNQIADFFEYLTQKAPLLIEHFISNNKIIPFIGIRYAPNFHRRRNTQRNTQIEVFRNKTGMKIKHGETLDLIRL